MLKGLKTWGENKLRIHDRTNGTVSAPLTSKVTATSRQTKTLEKQGKIKLHPGLNPRDEIDRSRADGTETIIIELNPNEVLTHKKKIDKQKGNRAHLIWTKTKQQMSNSQRTSRRRSPEEEIGSKPNHFGQGGKKKNKCSEV